MTKPEDVPQWAWEKAGTVQHTFCNNHHLWGELGAEKTDALHEIIARAILSAVEEEREAIASYVEGKGGVLPGTNGFAYVVSRNNQPCMSGDARDRLNKFDRRAFDAASASLASAIRNRKES